MENKLTFTGWLQHIKTTRQLLIDSDILHQEIMFGLQKTLSDIKMTKCRNDLDMAVRKSIWNTPYKFELYKGPWINDRGVFLGNI